MQKSLLCGLLLAGNLSFQPVQALFLPDQLPTEAKRLGLIVKFQPDSKPAFSKVASGQLQCGDRTLDELAVRFEVQEVEVLERDDRNGPSPLSGVCRLRFAGGSVTDEILQAYQSLPGVEYAEFDYRVTLFDLPDDSLFRFQWSLANSGQDYYHVNRNPGSFNDVMVMEHGTTDADIDADDVMVEPPDNTSTSVVAIIDTGVDLDHPDLAGRIWQNPGEVAANNLDDDHNGFVDDLHGWDYSGNENYLPIYHDADPTDTYGHGTHCAGIVAAAAGNDSGIVGIAPDCRIMALKFWPMLQMSSAAEAIIYAADNGADVINMSFGGPYPSQLLSEAIDYAYAKGVVLVAASGNSFTEAAFYPAAYPRVIAVGATDSWDHVTAFSTYGEHLDLCAPGNSILSLRADSTDMYKPSPGDEPNVHIVDGIYYEASGTSMAAPHVVGVAAYLRSVSPGLLPSEVANILTQTADDYIDPWGVGNDYPGWDPISGAGRVNLRRTLAAAPQVKAIITVPGPHAIMSGSIEIAGTAAGVNFAGYVLEYGLGNAPADWFEIGRGGTPMDSGTLGLFETSNLNGPVTIRLRVGETNADQVTVFAANQTIAEFVNPHDNDTLLGTMNLTVSAYCPDFSFAVLEYSKEVAPETWKTIDTLFEPSSQDANGIFKCSELPNGPYRLRLIVNSSSGPVAGDTIAVMVNSLFGQPFGWRINLPVAPAMTPNYGDFDRDGINEIVLGNEHGIRFYALDGTERTSGMPAFPDLDFRMPIPVGDLDGDSFDDFVAISASPPALYGFCSSGREIYLDLPRAPQNRFFFVSDELNYPILSLKDIDADGRDEVLYYSGYSGDAATQIVDLYTDDGSQQLESRIYGGRCLAVDLDGDGLCEICRLNGTLVTIYDLQGSPTGSYALPDGTYTFGMSAADVTGDNILELILASVPNALGGDGMLWIYAFGSGAVPVSGYPKPTQVSYFWAPSPPVYGDIDGDDVPEVLFTFYTDSYSFAYAYRLDGSPFLGDSTAIGAFAVSPWASIMRRPFLVNTSGGEGAEVITLAGRDYAMRNLKAALLCWDQDANPVPGWPIMLYEGMNVSIDYSTIPIFGDIDKDGRLDLLVATTQNQLLFANFQSVSFDSANSPCPMWRYNRSYNAEAPFWAGPSTAVEQSDGNRLPTGFVMFQNHPNPFNPATRIEFAITEAAHVRLDVLNVLGQRVTTLVDKLLPAATHSVSWDARNSPSGVYFYRITTGAASETKKMLLVK